MENEHNTEDEHMTDTEDENIRMCDSCWGTGVDDEGTECLMCGGVGYLTEDGLTKTLFLDP